MATLIRSEHKAVQGAQEEALAQGQQYLTFTVAAEVFAIPISTIKEIIEYRKPTDVPMMPPYMRGIINLRGRVVPVIDLSVRFGRDASEVSRRTCFVILEVEQQDERHDIGVVVDAVSAVVDIADSDIEPAPGFGANLRADFISGMGKMGEKFAIILDIAKVLSIDELALLTGGAEMQALPAAQASAQHT